jgi:hypothetical protein
MVIIAPTVAVISAMAVISTIATTVVSTVPIAMIPGIIAGPEIDPGITGIIPIISRIRSIRIRRAAIISGSTDPDAYPNVYSGIGLTGEAKHSQQCND